MRDVIPVGSVRKNTIKSDLHSVENSKCGAGTRDERKGEQSIVGTHMIVTGIEQTIFLSTGLAARNRRRHLLNH